MKGGGRESEERKREEGKSDEGEGEMFWKRYE